MTRFGSIAAALIVAGAAAAANAAAAPASLGHAAPPSAAAGEATLVHHWHRRCWPVHRWVWTHWGWRYRYVGHRCAPRYRHYHGSPHYRYRGW